MENRETSLPSCQGAAFEFRMEEDRIVDEYEESLTAYEGGPSGMGFVGNIFAESGKTTSFSGNNSDGASKSEARRAEGKDSSHEGGDTNQEILATRMQFLNPMHQDGAVKNDAIVQYSHMNTDLGSLDFGVHVPETNLNLGMSLGRSRGPAIHTKEDYERRLEKRKQSNRESARRSRLRRQQECARLRATAELLQSEISEIPYKLCRISEKCEKLNEENDNIIDELEKTYGSVAISDLRAVKFDCYEQKSAGEPKTPSRDNSTHDPLTLSLSLPTVC